MLKTSVFFLGGIVLLHALPALPGAWALAVIGGVWVFVLRFRLGVSAVALGLGFLWAWVFAEGRSAQLLPPSLAGQDLTVTGFVADIPERRTDRFLFLFDVRDPSATEIPRRLRLSWYEPERPPLAGERWRLTVRLKRPRGFSNPGGFDYEGWLFQHRIGATGYVRSSGEATRLGSEWWHYPLLRIRAAIAHELGVVLEGRPMLGIVMGLAVGERGAMKPAHWQVLSATGTNHLMAISGLHIGLVAGLGFFLARRLWRACDWLAARCSADDAGIVTAWILAACYALLAGLSIPTQRALIMLTAALALVWRRRIIAPNQAVGVALLIVLLCHPFAPLSPGFWLSFTAVGIILWSTGGRRPAARMLPEFGRIQGAVCLGVAPLTLAAFGSVSIVAPLVNAVMIPVFTFAIIPLILAGLVLLFTVPPAGAFVIETAAALLNVLWGWMAGIAEGKFVRLDSIAPQWASWLMIPGTALLLGPRGLPARYVGAIFLLPGLLWRPVALPNGALELTLLDVGQGLAAVVRTSRHTLVYDSGPSFRSGANTGDMVVLPFLRAKGIRSLDGLMLSHGDGDHIGGAMSVLGVYPETPVIGSASAQESFPARQPCLAGQSWTWDGVVFRVLHPVAGEEWSSNNGSCVLWVRSPGGSLLLTGDIEAEAEWALLRRVRDLAADVVVAAHHGSATSSTPALVKQVGAVYVLFAAGYANRWGFPDQDVSARWRQAGAHTHVTGDSGAISIMIDPKKGVQPPVSHRRLNRRHWTAP